MAGLRCGGQAVDRAHRGQALDAQAHARVAGLEALDYRLRRIQRATLPEHDLDRLHLLLARARERQEQRQRERSSAPHGPWPPAASRPSAPRTNPSEAASRRSASLREQPSFTMTIAVLTLFPAASIAWAAAL